MSLSYRDRRRSAPPAESFKFVVCDDYTIKLRLEEIIDSLAFSRDNLEELLVAKGYMPSSIQDDYRWQNACQVYGQAVDKYISSQPEPLSDGEPPTRLPTSRLPTARQQEPSFPLRSSETVGTQECGSQKCGTQECGTRECGAQISLSARLAETGERRDVSAWRTVGARHSLSARIPATLPSLPAPRPLSARLPPTARRPTWTLNSSRGTTEVAPATKDAGAMTQSFMAAGKQQIPLIPKLDLSQISPQEEPDWAASEECAKVSPRDLTLALRSRTLLCEALEEIAEDLHNVSAAVTLDYKDINRHNHKLVNAKEELERQLDEITRDFDVKLNELESLKTQLRERYRSDTLSQWRRSSEPFDTFGYSESTDEGHLALNSTALGLPLGFGLLSPLTKKKSSSPSPHRNKSSKRKRTINRQSSIEFRPRRILSVDRGCSTVPMKLRKLEAGKLEIEAEKKWRFPAWLSRKLPF